MKDIQKVFSELSANTIAVILGFIAMALSGWFGFKLRKPMVTQAIENEKFKSTIDGYNALMKAQSNQIAYLDTQVKLYREHEEELIRQLNEERANSAELMRRLEAQRRGGSAGSSTAYEDCG